MVKEEILRFKCDSCGKEMDSSNDMGFPYDKGWLYLHKFNGQIGKERSHALGADVGRFNYEDMHFCAEKCLYRMIGDTVKHAKTQSSEDFKEQDKNKQNFQNF